MVGAFSTFANKGVFIEPTFITHIEDKNGNLIEAFMPRQEEAMNEETAFLMLELMKGVVESGTGMRLRFRYGLNHPIGGQDRHHAKPVRWLVYGRDPTACCRGLG
jgi:penicillin-binding protein 1A